MNSLKCFVNVAAWELSFNSGFYVFTWNDFRRANRWNTSTRIPFCALVSNSFCHGTTTACLTSVGLWQPLQGLENVLKLLNVEFLLWGQRPSLICRPHSENKSPWNNFCTRTPQWKLHFRLWRALNNNTRRLSFELPWVRALTSLVLETGNIDRDYPVLCWCPLDYEELFSWTGIIPY